jgi:hypothetical protein
MSQQNSGLYQQPVGFHDHMVPGLIPHQLCPPMQYSIASNGNYRSGLPNSPYFGYPMPTHVPNWPIGAGVPYPWNTNPFFHSKNGQLINGRQVA